MNKTRILLLVGGVAVIVIVAVVVRYLEMRDKNINFMDQVSVPDVAEESKISFVDTSYQGSLQSASTEKIVVSEVNGGTVEYVPGDFSFIFDFRTRGEVKLMSPEDLREGMQVQVSTSTNQSDNSQAHTLTVY